MNVSSNPLSARQRQRQEANVFRLELERVTSSIQIVRTCGGDPPRRLGLRFFDHQTRQRERWPGEGGVRTQRSKLFAECAQVGALEREGGEWTRNRAADGAVRGDRARDRRRRR